MTSTQTINVCADRYCCGFCGETRDYDWGLVQVVDGSDASRQSCLRCYDERSAELTVVGD